MSCDQVYHFTSSFLSEVESSFLPRRCLWEMFPVKLQCLWSAPRMRTENGVGKNGPFKNEGNLQLQWTTITTPGNNQKNWKTAVLSSSVIFFQFNFSDVWQVLSSQPTWGYSISSSSKDSKTFRSLPEVGRENPRKCWQSWPRFLVVKWGM